jgi:hypothetical protein
MSLRCGCAAEGDEIVFGPAHECSKDPGLKRPRGPWANHIHTALGDRPYEHVLDEQERTGD